MKIQLLACVLIMAFASCGGSKSYHNALLALEKKVPIDERKLVLSGFPKSLTLLNDSQLVSIVDYKTIAVYNINSGSVQSNLELSGLFESPLFDLSSFIKKNCLGYYKDRTYIIDIRAIKEAAMPVLKITNILSSTGLDSVNLIAYIFCPYEKPAVYNNRLITATWLDYWPAIININVTKGLINSITSIVPDTVVQDYCPNPEFGSMLLYDKLYARASPDDTAKHIYEAIIYDLNTKKWQIDTGAQYPIGLNSDDWFTRTTFQHDEEGNVYYNDVFNIHAIGTGRRVSFKKFFDYNRHERIGTFAPLDENNFILTTKKKDSLNTFATFYFYNKSEDKLSKPAFSTIVENISPHIIFKKDKVIFISKDEQHYYIETHKIVMP